MHLGFFSEKSNFGQIISIAGQQQKKPSALRSASGKKSEGIKTK
jgi:hypothetical protein